MEFHVKVENPSPYQSEGTATPRSVSTSTPLSDPKPRSRKSDAAVDSAKRRCVSTACIACRKRKSKCDGNIPACAACSSVYGTECIYDPNSDHRRKGVYKKDIDSLKTRNSTLQTLIQALLNTPEDQVPDLVRRIRTCESLDKVADAIVAKERGEDEQDDDEDFTEAITDGSEMPTTFESQLSNKMGSMRLEDGSKKFIGGTSNLLFMHDVDGENDDGDFRQDSPEQHDEPSTSWTDVTSDPDLVKHLLNHYFTWHYTFFTILPKSMFYKQFLSGKPASGSRRKTEYCNSLLVNALLAIGCHFTSHPGSREDPEDSATAGDHFFKEARRLLYEEDVISRPSLATVQALALMSVREAGCAREANGWNYSGMAFRMSCDLGLSFQTATGYMLSRVNSIDEEEEDARRVTFWGCFLIDKCWSNYLGRLPQFQVSTNVTVPRYDVFPSDEADLWSPYSDSGFSQAHSQPSRVRTVALQISALCDISSDLIKNFYHPQVLDKPIGRQAELTRLGEIEIRLKEWKQNLPKELEPKEGTLSSVLVMHMFFQLLHIHLFRPFLKYNQATSPLPAHVSPRKACTQAAALISKLLRLYKRSHGLRQIVNFAVYIAHSACTIHILNLPDKIAKRDITHGVKNLEEIAEGWLAARRTLGVLSAQAQRWKIELPEEALAVLSRTDAKYGTFGSPLLGRSPTNDKDLPSSPIQRDPAVPKQTAWQSSDHYSNTANGNLFKTTDSMLPPPKLSQSSSVSAAYGYQAISPYQQLIPPQGNNLATTISPSRQSRNPSTHSQYHSQMPIQQQQPQMPQHVPSTRRQSDLQPSFQQPAKHQLPNNTGDMFGGVQALLREGQEWWMKDPTADLASGFGNWNNVQTTFEANGTSSWLQQQQQLQQPAKERQETWPVAGQGYGQGGVAPEQRRTSVVGSRGDAQVGTYADVGGGGSAGALGYGFGVLTNGYNEEEWYQ